MAVNELKAGMKAATVTTTTTIAPHRSGVKEAVVLERDGDVLVINTDDVRRRFGPVNSTTPACDLQGIEK